MSMTNEQIVNALISLYQKKGVPMVGLLSDPVFQGLSNPEKIQAIKQHAQTIVNNTPKGWTGKDAKDVLGLSAVAAGLGAIPAMGMVIGAPALTGAMIPHRYKTIAVALGTALGVGGVYHTLGNILQKKVEVDRRNDARQTLLNYMRTGSDVDAVTAVSSLRAAGPDALTRGAIGAYGLAAPDVKEKTWNIAAAYHKGQDWTKEMEVLGKERQATLDARSAAVKDALARLRGEK